MFWDVPVSTPRKTLSRYFLTAGTIPPQEGNRAARRDGEEEGEPHGWRKAQASAPPPSPGCAPCLPPAHPLAVPLGCSADTLPGQSTSGKRPPAFPKSTSSTEPGQEILPGKRAATTGYRTCKPCLSSPTLSAARRPSNLLPVQAKIIREKQMTPQQLC